MGIVTLDGRFLRVNRALCRTDPIMPKVSGPELVRRLRAGSPDIGVIRISGYSDHGFGGEDFIAKPFDPETLVREVRDVLDRPTP